MSIWNRNTRLRPRIEALEARDVPAAVHPVSAVPLNVAAASNQITNNPPLTGGPNVVPLGPTAIATATRSSSTPRASR